MFHWEHIVNVLELQGMNRREELDTRGIHANEKTELTKDETDIMKCQVLRIYEIVGGKEETWDGVARTDLKILSLMKMKGNGNCCRWSEHP